MPIAEGLEKAFLRGYEAGCNTIRMFTGYSNRWEQQPLKKAQIDLFHEVRKETGIDPVVPHAPICSIRLRPMKRSIKNPSVPCGRG